MLSLNIKFLNKTKKEIVAGFHHQEQGAPSVCCMTVTIFDPKEQKWDRIFIKWFCTYSKLQINYKRLKRQRWFQIMSVYIDRVIYFQEASNGRKKFLYATTLLNG